MSPKRMCFLCLNSAAVFISTIHTCYRDPGYDATRNLTAGTVLRNWVTEMMNFVRWEVKPQQLMFVGDVRLHTCCILSFCVHQLPTPPRHAQVGIRVDAQSGIPHSYLNTYVDLVIYCCSIHPLYFAHHPVHSGLQGGNARSYVCELQNR